MIKRLLASLLLVGLLVGGAWGQNFPYLRQSMSWHSGQFARSAAASAYPELWKSLVLLYAPAMGPTGAVVRDLSKGGHDGAIINTPLSEWGIATESRFKRYRLYLNNGAADESILIPSTFKSTAQTYTFVWAGWMGAVNNYLFDSQVGRLIISMGTSAVANMINFYDGTWRNPGTTGDWPDNVWHSGALTLKATTTTGEAFIDAISVGTAIYGSPKNINTSGVTRICNSFVGSTVGTGFKLDYFGIYERVLTNAEIRLWHDSHLPPLIKRLNLVAKAPAAAPSTRRIMIIGKTVPLLEDNLLTALQTLGR